MFVALSKKRDSWRIHYLKGRFFAAVTLSHVGAQCHIDYANGLCECPRQTLLTFLFQQLESRPELQTALTLVNCIPLRDPFSFLYPLPNLRCRNIITIFLPLSWSRISLWGIYFCVCEKGSSQYCKGNGRYAPIQSFIFNESNLPTLSPIFFNSFIFSLLPPLPTPVFKMLSIPHFVSRKRIF